jgi:hypothetical protein
VCDRRYCHKPHSLLLPTCSEKVKKPRPHQNEVAVETDLHEKVTESKIFAIRVWSAAHVHMDPTGKLPRIAELVWTLVEMLHTGKDHPAAGQ